jgi:hypothetical protein
MKEGFLPLIPHYCAGILADRCFFRRILSATETGARAIRSQRQSQDQSSAGGLRSSSPMRDRGGCSTRINIGSQIRDEAGAVKGGLMPDPLITSALREDRTRCWSAVARGATPMLLNPRWG